MHVQDANRTFEEHVKGCVACDHDVVISSALLTAVRESEIDPDHGHVAVLHVPVRVDEHDRQVGEARLVPFDAVVTPVALRGRCGWPACRHEQRDLVPFLVPSPYRVLYQGPHPEAMAWCSPKGYWVPHIVRALFYLVLGIPVPPYPVRTPPSRVP